MTRVNGQHPIVFFIDRLPHRPSSLLAVTQPDLTTYKHQVLPISNPPQPRGNLSITPIRLRGSPHIQKRLLKDILRLFDRSTLPAKTKRNQPRMGVIQLPKSRGIPPADSIE